MSTKVIIPVWGRIEPLRRHITETSKLFDYMYVVSPEDPLFIEVMNILEGKEVIFCKNEPVSEKINLGIRSCDVDYIINCGSDDILYDELYRVYENETHPFCAVNHRDIEGANLTRALFGVGRRTLRKYLKYPPCNRRMDTLSMQIVLEAMRKEWRRNIAIGRAKRRDIPNLKIIDSRVPLFKSIYTSGDNITCLD